MLYLTPASEMSAFEELWLYFVDKYFSNDLPYLENFTIKGNQFLFYKLIIIGLCVGIIIASLCNLFNKRYVGDFVRKLLSEGCTDQGSAKTLDELGYNKKLGIYWVIRTGGSLTGWVRCVEEDEFVAELEKRREEFNETHASDKKKPKFKEPTFKRDLKTMHFYLPEEKKISAEIKFDPKGATWGGVLLVTVVSIALCLALCYLLADIIKLLDNFLSVMGKNE